jgi:hypothetical protein
MVGCIRKRSHRATALARRADEWHEAMMAQGPDGFIRARGVSSWHALHIICAKMVADWECLSKHQRDAYAYPNPEDKRRAAP